VAEDVSLLLVSPGRIPGPLPQALECREYLQYDKAKFGDLIRSKTDTAMVNESLLKVLCHNPVVLIHEMYELGIEPVFWANLAAQKQGELHNNSV
jgi:hypothetical protein